MTPTPLDGIKPLFPDNRANQQGHLARFLNAEYESSPRLHAFLHERPFTEYHPARNADVPVRIKRPLLVRIFDFCDWAHNRTLRFVGWILK
jgi:hypothetical protein